MFCGSLLAVVSAFVLIFAGSRVLAVVTALGQADAGLRNDLNVARLAAIGLGVALALVMYALSVARRARHINRAGQCGLVVAGLLTLLAGVLLFAAFHGVAGELHELDAMHHLFAGHDQLEEDVKEAFHRHSGSAASGFGMLMGAMLVLSLSLWSLFWLPVSPAEPDRWSRPTALAGAAGALLWASLLAGATFSGALAIEAGAADTSPAFQQAHAHVNLTLLAAQGAALGLALYGLALAIFGLLFRVQ